MLPVDDDLVLQARGVGKPVHLRRIGARHARGGFQEHPGGGARGDKARLGARKLGYHVARLPVEVVHVHEPVGSVVHGIDDGGLHDAAAQLREP